MIMSNTVTAIVNRYSDAYLVARTTNGFGATAKVIGLIIAGVIAVGAFSQRETLGLAVVLIGFAAALLIATAFYLFGTLASAQGQILKAALDTAVNTSRWLSDDDRARIMSLPPVTAA
jgi:hypothetical protein